MPKPIDLLLVLCLPACSGSSTGAGSSSDTSAGSAVGRPQASPTVTQSVVQPSNLEARYQEILEAHNQYRQSHCAPDLQWSSELAEVAQDWADKLRDAQCAFKHRQPNRFGENLTFFAPVDSLSPADVAKGWYQEVDDYNFANHRFDFSTGHFTQLVWGNTTRLGCGVSQCKGGQLWVCNYDPPGNMLGAFEQEVKPTTCR